MYPDIAPKLALEQTVNNPEAPEEVIGFTARNKMLGQKAIVIKGEFVEDGEVPIPEEQADTLRRGKSELVVLLEDSVLVMRGLDFATQADVWHRMGGGNGSTITEVPINSEFFRRFDEREVQVSN